MKQLPVILLIIVILLGGFTIWRYIEVMSPVWTVTAAQQAAIDLQQRQQDAQVDAQSHRDRAQLFTGWLQGIGSGLVLLIFGFGGVYIWRVYDQRRESWARAVDGQFALQQFNQAGQTWAIDPNKSVFGVIGQDKRTGQITTDANMVGADRQLAYAQDVQRTRTAAAMSGEGGIRNSAQAKFAAGFYDRPQRHDEYQVSEPEPAQLATTPFTPMNLLEAFAQSKRNQWLIGQNVNGLCTFNMFSTVHAAILGSSNSGKTSSTGLLLAANARKSGMNVIALDAANGIDWMPYSSTFEVYETDYRVIGDQLNQIIRIHDQRKKACVFAGVKTIYDLDYTIPPVLVVLEEFGRLMQSFKNVDPENYENIVVALTVLMSDSRKSGINFLFIDQGMQVWDKRFKTNIRDYIAYKMNAKQGSAFDAYDLHLLKPQGQFWNNGEIYNAWHTAPEFKLLQKELQPQRIRLLTDSQPNMNDTSIDTGIVKEGVSKGKIYPPANDTGIDTSNENTPVDDTSIDTSIDTSPDTSAGIDTSIKKPLLMGKPVSTKDQSTVRNIHAMTGSINETCRLVWGAKTPSRAQWVKEVLQGSVVQQ